MNILRIKKCNVVKYTTFCRGINWDCLASLKKTQRNINNIDNQLHGFLYSLYQWWTVKQISDNEIYLLIKYIKCVLWRVAKRLSYTEDALKIRYGWSQILSSVYRLLYKSKLSPTTFWFRPCALALHKPSSFLSTITIHLSVKSEKR